MPVVGRRDRDRVDVGAVEEPADVLDVFRRPQFVLVVLLTEPDVGPRVAVADGDEVDLRRAAELPRATGPGR